MNKLLESAPVFASAWTGVYTGVTDGLTTTTGAFGVLLGGTAHGVGSAKFTVYVATFTPLELVQLP